MLAGHNVRGAEAMETMAIHDTGEALALGGADDVDALTDLETKIEIQSIQKVDHEHII